MTVRIKCYWLLPLALLLALELAACDSDTTKATKNRLAGTWIAETAGPAGRVQRVLTLGIGGGLKDASYTLAAGGALPLEVREGEWFFDGVNFKRKYTSIDGKRLTNAFFIYETHQLTSVSASELVGVSRVGQGEIRFRRATPDPPR
jgi:hypothetical protein